MNEDPLTGPTTTPPPGGTGTPTLTRRFRLVRSRQDRRLGGVAGGLAVAADLDPTLVRIAFVLAGLSGWGIAAYLVAWLLAPEEDPAVGLVPEPAPEKTARRLRIGLAIVAAVGALRIVGAVFGVAFAALSFFFDPFDTGLFLDGGNGHWFPFRTMVGLTLLLAGGLALMRRRAERDGQRDSWGDEAASPGTPGLPGGGGGAAPPGRPTPGTGPAAAPVDASQRRRTWLLLVARAFGWMSALWFLGAGAMVTALWSVGAIELHWPLLFFVVAVGALGTLVVALLRAARLSQLLGAVALLFLPVLVALGLVRFDGPVGYRSVAPQAKAELESVYRHGAGELDLDLSGLTLPAGITRVRVVMGAGQVDIRVPWDVNVVASARVRAGSFTLLGRHQSGLTIEGQARSEGEPGAATLEIEAVSRVGRVLVQREEPPATPPTTAQVPAEPPAEPTPPPPAPGPPSEPGTYLCTIPPGGGPAECRPT